jgi:hypothetical protein
MGNIDSTPSNGYQVKKIIKKSTKPDKSKQSTEVNNKINHEINNHKVNNHNQNLYEKKHEINNQPRYQINNNFEKSFENPYDRQNYNIQDKDIQNKDREKNNNLIIERSMFPIIKEQDNKFNPYPTNSNYECSEKKIIENIKFTPYNFTDEVDKFKKEINTEKDKFEENEKIRRSKFEKELSEKERYLNEQIKYFEDNYNPWEILGLEDNDLDSDNIKRAYKKNALKYHPDRAGKKYEDRFQLISQSYIYLLKKSEENNSLNIKINKKVEKMEYEDNINDNLENIYVSKDKFDIKQFNKIFDKFKLPSSFDKGYSDIMTNKDGRNNEAIENNQIFGSKVSQDIFNAHFDKIKNKKSNELIEFKEPLALETSLSNFNQSMLGEEDVDDFGAVNSNGLSYTDYKKAHIDETLLIDVNKVKYKSYKSVEQLENDRSNISYIMTPEEKRRSDFMERKRLEDDQNRMLKQKNKDDMMENHYRKINQRLIVHK